MPNLVRYAPEIIIELEGTDITDRSQRANTLTISRNLSYPVLTRFTSAEIGVIVDNSDGEFHTNQMPNFFTKKSLPVDGRGAKILIKIGLSSTEIISVFAGQIYEVETALGTTNAILKAVDLGARANITKLNEFGQSITRRITDFEGATSDYSDAEPVFKFPKWGLPIIEGSVTLTTSPSVTIVDQVAMSGTLSKTNVSIDYKNGIIRYEAAPDDGADTTIDATWRVDYKYKRPDALITLLLENIELDDEINISNKTNARFAVEKALVTGSTETFSSNGRPYFEDEGITRWLKRDTTNKKIFMIQDRNLIEYDEELDEYTKVATVPDDNTITGSPPGGYGTEITDEGFNIALSSSQSQLFTAFAISPTGVAYIPFRYNQSSQSRVGMFRYGLDGTRDTSEFILHQSDPGNPLTANNLRISGLTWGNDFLLAVSSAGTAAEINPSTGFVETLGFSDGASIVTREGVSYYNNNWYTLGATSITQGISGFRCNKILIYNSTRQLQSGGFDLPSGWFASGIAVTQSYIYLSVYASSLTNPYFIAVFNHSGTEQSNLRFYERASSIGQDQEIRGIYIHNERLYGVSGSNTQGKIQVFSIAASLNYHNFIPYQFDTPDFDTFYFLTTNTVKGDLRQDTTFNQNRVSKYVKSTNTWSNLLTPSIGNPQLAHPVEILNDIREYADNRKNFQVIVKGGKTLIFYRRVESAHTGITMYNETDNTFTNVYRESFGTNDGLPYSMDFWLDDRTDGIHVYTFVLKRSISSGQTTVQMRIYRKRERPSGTQTTLFTESFTTSNTNDFYPISVSDIKLADGRSKFYFTLTYANRVNDNPGKAELCTIAKDGSGSRTVIKTYNNSLLSSRSPLEVGSGSTATYYYLEGTSHRRPKSSTDPNIPAEEHYYPNEGGHLIEVTSTNTVTDKGQIWRSATKSDSPDPENMIFDGWGLHNAVTSNMIVDDRDNFHFICGYGSPYRINNNLPSVSNATAIANDSNFIWVQYGKDLATKIAQFKTGNSTAWPLMEQLATLIRFEIGFMPATAKVNDIRTKDSSISEWSANSSLFFRPKTILPAKLRSAITATATITSIALNDSGLPSEISEFPAPGTNEKYMIIIGRELFTYTGVTADTQGRTLTGVTRAENLSTAAAHSANSNVYFVDYFTSGQLGLSDDLPPTLIAIPNKSYDLENLYNNIVIPFGDISYTTKDSDSITNNKGEFTFTLDAAGTFLVATDNTWAKLIGDAYLSDLGALREIIILDVLFNPKLQPGQLIVVYQKDRVQIPFNIFKIVQVTHSLPDFQTFLTAREFIDSTSVTTPTITATTLRAVSGNGQSGTVSTALSQPFLVEVRDQNDLLLPGITVNFAVQTGGGSISSSSIITNNNGQGSTILTLGSSVGINTVRASVTGITATVDFTAMAVSA